MEKYSIYKYFKGEDSNPFDSEKQNYQNQFWMYESLFEHKFNRADFNPDVWLTPTMLPSTIQEMKEVLSENPISKEELFSVWLFSLLMEYLPDKNMPDHENHYNKLYWDTTSTSK